MAPPSGSSSATTSRVKTRRWKLKSRRFHSVKKKKQNQQRSNIRSSDHDDEQETMMISSSSSSGSNDDCTQILEELDIIISDGDDNGCSTPKGERFRIPQVSTCPPPPPPKKPKSLPNNFYNHHHRSPIPFFASPELELFFLGALRDISV